MDILPWTLIFVAIIPLAIGVGMLTYFKRRKRVWQTGGQTSGRREEDFSAVAA